VLIDVRIKVYSIVAQHIYVKKFTKKLRDQLPYEIDTHNLHTIIIKLEYSMIHGY
jgi:hypothetical protein